MKAILPIITLVLLLCTVVLQIAVAQLNTATACRRATKSVAACPVGAVAQFVLVLTGKPSP